MLRRLGKIEEIFRYNQLLQATKPIQSIIGEMILHVGTQGNEQLELIYSLE